MGFSIHVALITVIAGIASHAFAQTAGTVLLPALSPLTNDFRDSTNVRIHHGGNWVAMDAKDSTWNPNTFIWHRTSATWSGPAARGARLAGLFSSNFRTSGLPILSGSTFVECSKAPPAEAFAGFAAEVTPSLFDRFITQADLDNAAPLGFYATKDGMLKTEPLSSGGIRYILNPSYKEGDGQSYCYDPGLISTSSFYAVVGTEAANTFPYSRTWTRIGELATGVIRSEAVDSSASSSRVIGNTTVLSLGNTWPFVWDATTGTSQTLFPSCNGTPVVGNALAISENGNWALANIEENSCLSGGLYRVNIETSTFSSERIGAAAEVAFIANNGSVAARSENGHVLVWLPTSVNPTRLIDAARFASLSGTGLTRFPFLDVDYTQGDDWRTSIRLVGLTSDGSSVFVSLVNSDPGFVLEDLGVAHFDFPPCRADFDASGFVDSDDFDFYVSLFTNGCTGPGTPDPSCAGSADLDGSDFVDGDDYIEFVRLFAEAC